MKKQIRGVATIKFYVYGKNEKELLKQSKKIIKKMNKKYDCNAEINSLEVGKKT